jgi:hypothetical protein
MKELRSKRLRDAAPQILSDEEFDELVANGVISLKNYHITDIKVRKIIPPLSQTPTEVRQKFKKYEG